MAEGSVRVLQALTTAEVGGTEIMVWRLVRGLEGSRVVCEVSVLRGDGPLAGRLESRGVRVHRLGAGAGVAGAFSRLVRVLRAGRFHVLHLYGFQMSLLGRLAARLVRPRPAVVHGIRGLHVAEVEDVGSWRGRGAILLERLGSRLVDLYVSNSGSARAFLCSRGLPAEKFVTIPNGVEVDGGPSARSGARGPGAEGAIVCVANLRPVKRHRDLVDALAVLRSRGVKAVCTLVGDGPCRAALEAQVRALSLDAVVRFAGRQPPEALPALLRDADLFVLPSLWEGMPGSVLEAMAMAVPVIATDVPGIREVVDDGVTGYLVPPSSPAALADRLERLLGDSHLRAAMGERARARARDAFSLARMIAGHTDLYLALAGARRAV